LITDFVEDEAPVCRQCPALSDHDCNHITNRQALSGLHTTTGLEHNGSTVFSRDVSRVPGGRLLVSGS